MASLILAYEYDVFISYRQKDNKHDGWVTEFANNLKGELESTFKEDISVYFDINPHDGLLETHDVDASLKDKLKCLVFIPIISHTYCDPKSFAWDHEFKAFIEQASQDQFGLKVRLPNGNVANRILPVQIHDLHPEDKSLIEKELGGVLRSIEFIYKEPGVNRPLRVSDNEDKNFNKTNYRNQINKVANAIDEIIHSLKDVISIAEGNNPINDLSGSEVKEESNTKEQPAKKFINKKTQRLLIALLLLFLIIAGAYISYKIIDKNRASDDLTNYERTIAVLPFRNLSNDTLQLPFCDGFMEDLINNLQKVKSFTVRPRTSTYQYKNTEKSTAIIRKELNVNYLVGGSIGQEGNDLKIRVYLIDSEADKQIWSNDYTREMSQFFPLQSQIAKEIASELKAVPSVDEIEMIEKRPTENPEAYKYYLQGEYYYWKNDNSGDNAGAIELYNKAIELDPKFALAYTGVAKCLLDQYWYYKDRSEDILRRSKLSIDYAFEYDPDLPEANLVLGIYYYHGYLNYPEALKQFEIILKNNPKNAYAMEWAAAVYRRAGNFEMAKYYFEKASELNPRSSSLAQEAGETSDLLGDYSKAEEYYNRSIILQPDYVYTYYALSNMILKWKGDIKRAREILADAALNNKSSLTDSLVIETNILIDICEGKYQEALNDVSLFRNEVVQTHWFFKPKYLYYANIYGFMNKPELSRAYYDSARIFLEHKIVEMHDDPALYSSLGIAYAGLGLKEKAVKAGKRGVDLMPVDKDALRGASRVEDLALIYTMVGEYDEALMQIKSLQSVPGFISIKILEMDPRWEPLKKLPRYKIMLHYLSK
jgi:TolB-like protein/Tfp pilus assembly protein PilF